MSRITKDQMANRNTLRPVGVLTFTIDVDLNLDDVSDIKNVMLFLAQTMGAILTDSFESADRIMRSDAAREITNAPVISAVDFHIEASTSVNGLFDGGEKDRHAGNPFDSDKIRRSVFAEFPDKIAYEVDTRIAMPVDFDDAIKALDAEKEINSYVTAGFRLGMIEAGIFTEDNVPPLASGTGTGLYSTSDSMTERLHAAMKARQS